MRPCCTQTYRITSAFTSLGETWGCKEFGLTFTGIHSILKTAPDHILVVHVIRVVLQCLGIFKHESKLRLQYRGINVR